MGDFMIKMKSVLLGVMGVFIFTALSIAQPADLGADRSSQKAHFEKRIQEIYAQLNLTDEQKQQLDVNKKGHRAKMESARQEFKTDKQALQAEIMKTPLDMSKVNALHNQIKALQAQMEDDRLSSILAVRTILTPEQFTKFINLMHQHKHEHDD